MDYMASSQTFSYLIGIAKYNRIFGYQSKIWEEQHKALRGILIIPPIPSIPILGVLYGSGNWLKSLAHA